MFNDLMLNVAGSTDLEASLQDEYGTVETMDGDNKYHCDTCNAKVVAERGT